MKPVFDVAVIGAGLVGATLVCGLARAGFRVLVVESGQPAQFDYVDNQYGLRVSAISPASEELFRRWQLWDAMCVRVFPYSVMQVWDATGGGRICFDAADIGETRLGHIVENQHMLAVLHTALRALPNVELCWGVRLESMEAQGDARVLRLSDGRKVRVGLVAGTDGADSKVRQLAGIEVVERDYLQSGLVTVVEVTDSHQHTAWQRFLPEGPLAFLPLGERRCSIVWSTSPEHARWLKALSEVEFCRELTQASGYRFGNVCSAGVREAFPLRFLHAGSYVRSSVVLLGDAAHVVHPLAGQGVNLGLLDVDYLVSVLSEGHQVGRPVYAAGGLRRYERFRRSENQLMLLGLDGIKMLFAASAKPVVDMRSLGMGWVDRVTPLKHFLMREAMGQLRRQFSEMS